MIIYFMLLALHKGKLRMLRWRVGHPRGTAGLESRQSCSQAFSPGSQGAGILPYGSSVWPSHSCYLFCYFLPPAL